MPWRLHGTIVVVLLAVGSSRYAVSVWYRPDCASRERLNKLIDIASGDRAVVDRQQSWINAGMTMFSYLSKAANFDGGCDACGVE